MFKKEICTNCCSSFFSEELKSVVPAQKLSNEECEKYGAPLSGDFCEKCYEGAQKEMNEYDERCAELIKKSYGAPVFD